MHLIPFWKKNHVRDDTHLAVPSLVRPESFPATDSLEP